MTNAATQPATRPLAGPVLLFLTSCFVWASLFTWNAADWPNPNHYPHLQPASNACGTVGAWIAHYAFYYLGDGIYILSLFASLAALTSLTRGRMGHPWQRGFGVALLVTATATSVQLLASVDPSGLPEGPGGILGLSSAKLLHRHVSNLGAILILGYVFFMGLLFASQGWMAKVPAFLIRTGQAAVGSLEAARAARVVRSPLPATSLATVSSLTALDEAVAPRSTRSSERLVTPAASPRHTPSEPIRPTEPLEEDTTPARRPPEAANTDTDPEDTRPRKEAPPRIVVRHAQAPKNNPPTESRKLVVHQTVSRNEDSSELGVEPETYSRPLDAWEFPSLTLLDDAVHGLPKDHESSVRAKAKTVERTLEDFRVGAQVVQIDTGPVITMYELQLAAGVKVSQIASLSNDIARALKATSVRVVAPIPGKNTVGIEVPNLHKHDVRLKELLNAGGRQTRPMSLPLFIGKDAGGNPLVADLADMPHLLIAGTTGSGKSVCINSLIASFLMTQRPDWLKLILVDPKMVELTPFKDVPHLMSPIVTDVKRAEVLLEWAVTKMDERYALLSEARVRNISDYNELGEAEIMRRFNPANARETAQIPVRLPYLVIVIDELADLMMTSAKAVEHHLCRLAQKSRAVGIHLIVATQRPEAKVVTGLIKSNLPCRIAFRVASRIDSRIVLDQNGAEMLMGQGDMLFLPPGSAKLVRAQGTYVSDIELHGIIEDLKTKAQPQYHNELLRLTSTAEAAPSGERDPMFDEAVRIVLESGRGSVSLIQRRLNIGYSRASRLIDQMSDAGIVGTFKGSQAREVQMTLEEYESVRNQARREEAADDDEADCSKRLAISASEPMPTRDRVEPPSIPPDQG